MLLSSKLAPNSDSKEHPMKRLVILALALCIFGACVESQLPVREGDLGPSLSAFAQEILAKEKVTDGPIMAGTQTFNRKTGEWVAYFKGGSVHVATKEAGGTSSKEEYIGFYSSDLEEIMKSRLEAMENLGGYKIRVTYRKP